MNWTVQCVEYYLYRGVSRTNAYEFMQQSGESLIQAVAAGHGSRVKRMMEESGLTEPMEPLWHATRAELGEELEPLPAEIMETVMDIRQEFSDMRR